MAPRLQQLTAGSAGVITDGALGMKHAGFLFFVLMVACPGVLGQRDTPAGPAALPEGLSAEHAQVTGNLVIRAVQGTTGAAEPGGNPVQVHFFHRGQPFQKLDAVLDENGLLVLSDLPAAMALLPLVQIEHAGVTYQDAGPEITAQNRDVTVEVTVFETTTTRPAWRVESRQVMVTPGDGAMLVSESVLATNPNDKTWLGGEEASNGKLTTVELGLPAGAADVSLVGGFHGWCCTTFEDSRLRVQMPLMPGRSSYHFTYEVPTADGAGALDLNAAAETDELAVIVPESGITAEATGLTAGSVQMTEQGPLRLYSGREIGSDTTPAIRLTGLPVPTRAPEFAPGEVPVSSPSGGTPWGVIVGSGVAIFVGLALVIGMSRRKC